MNRRLFISTLTGGALADPEELIWTPWKKMISIPSPRLVPSEATRRRLEALFNNLFLPTPAPRMWLRWDREGLTHLLEEACQKPFPRKKFIFEVKS